jgi:hypothetical protein
MAIVQFNYSFKEHGMFEIASDRRSRDAIRAAHEARGAAVRAAWRWITLRGGGPGDAARPHAPGKGPARR